MSKAYFIRVRAGVVLEKGLTDAVAFAAMQADEPEYVAVTLTQHAAVNVDDPAP